MLDVTLVDSIDELVLFCFLEWYDCFAHIKPTYFAIFRISEILKATLAGYASKITVMNRVFAAIF